MKQLFVFIFLTCFAASADEMADKAMKKAAEAFSKTGPAKKAIKKVERKIYNSLPVEKETAVVIGTTAIALVQGRVDTKNIKNMDVKTMGGKVRADVEYTFKDKQVTGLLIYKTDW